MVLATVVKVTDMVRLEFRGRSYREVRVSHWNLSASTRIVHSIMCLPGISLPKRVRVAVLEPTTSRMSFTNFAASAAAADNVAYARDKFAATRGASRVVACHQLAGTELASAIKQVQDTLLHNIAESQTAFEAEARLMRTYFWTKGWIAAHKFISKHVTLVSTTAVPEEHERIQNTKVAMETALSDIGIAAPMLQLMSAGVPHSSMAAASSGDVQKYDFGGPYNEASPAPVYCKMGQLIPSVIWRKELQRKRRAESSFSIYTAF